MKPTSEDATRLGLSQSHFFVMKKTQPNRYQYITALSDNLHDAYVLYTEETEALVQDCTDMYYWLEDNRLINKFSHAVQKEGFYGNSHSFSTGIGAILFKPSNTFNKHETFIKYKSIIKLFDTFQKEYE